VRSIKVPEKYYAEGAACLGDRIIQLTWRNGVALIYDVENMHIMDHYTYKGKGWGLASDGLKFYMTDGSHWLTCRGEKFDVIRRVPVKACGRRVRGLNALDYVEGRLLVNVYGLDDVLVIDPFTGKVQAVISCHALAASQGQRKRGEVLNGIAYDPNSGEIYLTGKGWDRYYVVQADEFIRSAPPLIDDNFGRK
jgi:glutamine cyclotransferase